MALGSKDFAKVTEPIKKTDRKGVGSPLCCPAQKDSCRGELTLFLYSISPKKEERVQGRSLQLVDRSVQFFEMRVSEPGLPGVGEG